MYSPYNAGSRATTFGDARRAFKFTAQHRNKGTTAEVCVYVDLGQ